MARPLLLDLFCGAGGAAYGYMLAGFDVVGVDIKPQPRYKGNRFIQDDALAFVSSCGQEFDAIHASPPCQRYCELTPLTHRGNHPDLIEPTRKALQAIGRPYVIENVENARHLLINPIMLCGSMFGLPLQRHRYFEVWPEIFGLLPPCNHSVPPVLISGSTTRFGGKKYEFPVGVCSVAAGVDWMTRKELDQAIPPAYTQWIGRHLIEHIRDAVR